MLAWQIPTVEAKHKAKADSKWWVEEEEEQADKETLRSVELLEKQKGQVEGEQITCN